MQCPGCRTENLEGARFCTNCGSRLAVRCPQCGTPLPPQAKFCMQCGAEMRMSEPAALSESIAERLRRLVPVEVAERLLPRARDRVALRWLLGLDHLAEHRHRPQAAAWVDGGRRLRRWLGH